MKKEQYKDNFSDVKSASNLKHFSKVYLGESNRIFFSLHSWWITAKILVVQYVYFANTVGYFFVYEYKEVKTDCTRISFTGLCHEHWAGNDNVFLVLHMLTKFDDCISAKMFSVMSVFESVASLVATSLFNPVYNASLNVYHGLCFFMAAGIVMLALVIAG